jgi:periplasmic mercuric ion binding protein
LSRASGILCLSIPLILFFKDFIMKLIQGLLVAMLTILSVAVFAQNDSTTFRVAGNCGMCKKRIEASLKGPGVSLASWDVKSKIMTVRFDSAKINAKQLQQKVAAVGHDTEMFTADTAVYEELPGCCLYDRTTVKTNVEKSKDHSGQ